LTLFLFEILSSLTLIRLTDFLEKFPRFGQGTGFGGRIWPGQENIWMSHYPIDVGGVGNGGCLAPMCSSDACIRNYKMQERRFGTGQMKTVGKGNVQNRLANYLERQSGKSH
jgi:hypothetical protein